jgi:hypothetical protein
MSGCVCMYVTVRCKISTHSISRTQWWWEHSFLLNMNYWETFHQLHRHWGSWISMGTYLFHWNSTR